MAGSESHGSESGNKGMGRGTILFIKKLKEAYADRLRALGEDVVVSPDRDHPDTLEALSNAEVIAATGGWLTLDLLAQAPKLRWVHAVSAGVDALPYEWLREQGILVSNSSGIHGKQMAEQILGMMIAFSRGLHANLRSQLGHRWEHTYRLHELDGQTLVVVGAGHIGQETARKAKAFDMRTIGVRRTAAPTPYFDATVGMDQLTTALAEADYVVVLTPLTPATAGLIGREQLAALKPSAVILNFARGDVIDEPALISALQAEAIRGAGLDVFHEEPLPTDSPLWDMDNVLITPHTGGWSPHHDARFIDLFIDNLKAYRSGHPLPSAVDLDQRY